MKKYIPTTLLLLTLHCSLFTLHLSSQPCLPEGIEFTTQTQIDSFQINYPECTEIEGDVIIDGTNINDLSGLNVVTIIGGDLIFGSPWAYGSNPNLATLGGLNGISSIGGSLELYHNHAITNLAGLDNLTSIGGDFHIDDNTNLTSLAELGNLTTIPGNLIINFSSNLPNLSGLDNLTSIGGDLWISQNGNLSSLTGLNNLTSIGGDLNFIESWNLTSMAGLNNLTSIGGDLNFVWNHHLINMEGFESLSSIEGTLKMQDNDSLINLSGLYNLSNIGGSLVIGAVPWGGGGNQLLTSLDSLDNLLYVGEDLIIAGNNSLTNIDGLVNLNSIGGDLMIRGNNSLSLCDIFSICEYLSAPNGTVTIYGNAPGCSNPGEIAMSCGIQLPCLPFGNYYFKKQADIDNFQSYYPDCTELEELVYITGDDISNLDGLNLVTSINGELDIRSNELLTSLSGLENISYIGGALAIIHNDALINLTGLENLSAVGEYIRITDNFALNTLNGLENITSIEGYLRVKDNNNLNSLTGLVNVTSIEGDLIILNNDELISLAGLEGVTSLEGYLEISGNESLNNLNGLSNLVLLGGDLIIGGFGYYYANPQLQSLEGIKNIDYGSIENLTISNNALLSECDVQSICDYLAEPNGNIDINNNNSGCNSQEEVEDACIEVSLDELIYKNNFTISPNPTSGIMHLQFTISNQSLTSCELFDISGIRVKSLLNEMKMPGTYEIELDLRGLPKGIYFCVLKTNSGIQTQKLIKL